MNGNQIASCTFDAVCAVIAGITIGILISVTIIAADIGLVNLW